MPRVCARPVWKARPQRAPLADLAHLKEVSVWRRQEEPEHAASRQLTRLWLLRAADHWMALSSLFPVKGHLPASDIDCQPKAGGY